MGSQKGEDALGVSRGDEAKYKHTEERERGGINRKGVFINWAEFVC